MDISNLLITEDETIIDAMKALDESAKKVVFVAVEGKLLASISDGDIRRWILKGGSLEAKAGLAANYHPKYIKRSELSKAKNLMLEWHVEVLPVVSDGLVIMDMVFGYEDSEKNGSSDTLKNIPIVIMAGGIGTRLYPYTKILPKPLIPIGDIPITELIMDRFRSQGCRDFYMIVNHKKNMIKAYYNEVEKDYRINYIDEDVPLGTGGGVGLLKGRIDRTFILTNCDTLIDQDYTKIVREHCEKQNMVTMVCSLKDFDIPYGVVDIGADGEISAMREKPHYSFFTNTGTYIVEPQVIDIIAPNKSVGFPSIIQTIKDDGGKVGVYPIGKAGWMDMGQLEELDVMKIRLGVE